MDLEWSCLDCKATGTYLGDSDPATDFGLANVQLQEHADEIHYGEDRLIPFMLTAGEPWNAGGAISLKPRTQRLTDEQRARLSQIDDELDEAIHR